MTATVLQGVLGSSVTVSPTAAATLAAAAFAGCAAINVAGGFTIGGESNVIPDDIMLTAVATLATGSPADLKGFNLYLAASEDGTHYDDNANYSGSDGTISSPYSPNNWSLPYFVSAPNSGSVTYYAVMKSLSRLLGSPIFLPRKVGLIVENRTNLAFTAFSFTYTPVAWQNA